MLLFRRALGLLTRRAMLPFVRSAMRTAVKSTTDAAVQATSESFRQVFNVRLPLTVYVRASSADVTVKRAPGERVELHANLVASFGLEFATDQDEDGVYIVAKRKPVVGAISIASFTLVVPPEANLVLHLTPGVVSLHDVNGKITLPGNQVPLRLGTGVRLLPRGEASQSRS